MKKPLWINQVSPSFCPSRWSTLAVNPAIGGLSTCCHHEYKKIKMVDLYTSQSEEIVARQQMLDGGYPKDCQKCWSIENSGGVSPREYRAEYSGNYPIKVKSLAGELKLQENPSWIDLRMGRVCQFSCLYCSDDYSTAWENEFKIRGPFSHKSPSFKNETELSDEDQKEYYDKIVKAIPRISQLSITGGEPLLNAPTYRIFEALKLPRTFPIHVNIYTNICPPENYWKKLIIFLNEIKSYPQVYLYLNISNEAWGHQAEFIRRGLKFEILQKRVLEILNQTQTSLYFVMSTNILSLWTLPEYMNWLAQLKKHYQTDGRFLKLMPNLVLYPDYFSIGNLGNSDVSLYFRNYITDYIQKNKNFIDENEQAGLESMIAVLDKPYSDQAKLKAMKEFLDASDLRFKTDWRNLFPNLVKHLL